MWLSWVVEQHLRDREINVISLDVSWRSEEQPFCWSFEMLLFHQIVKCQPEEHSWYPIHVDR